MRERPPLQRVRSRKWSLCGEASRLDPAPEAKRLLTRPRGSETFVVRQSRQWTKNRGSASHGDSRSPCQEDLPRLEYSRNMTNWAGHPHSASNCLMVECWKRIRQGCAES